MRVARRAGVSRGAQQHHFVDRAELIVAAVRHLAERQIAEQEVEFARAPRGAKRVERVLDVVFAQYSGPLLALVLELSLSARADPEIHAAVAEQEREISRAIQTSLATAVGAERWDEVSARWVVAISSARGTALLLLLGHPRATVQRQWQASRRELAEMLGCR